MLLHPWGSTLRDGSTATWSQPAPSYALGSLGRQTRLAPKAPSLHTSREDNIKRLAVEHDEDLRLVNLCQKAPEARTPDEVRYIQLYMCYLSHFFALWPQKLQHEMARALVAHIFVRHEVALQRGHNPGRLHFILNGKLGIRVPRPTGLAASAAAAAVHSAAKGGVPVESPRQAAEAAIAAMMGMPARSPRGNGTEGAGAGAAENSDNVGGLSNRGEVTVALLGRGHTCGEATLLGSGVQLTTVVVESPTAVLLSLTHSDIMRAFKAVLGIRQQDRLQYLERHPLLASVPREDLQRLAVHLHQAFHPPGARLWPPDGASAASNKDRGYNVHFVAEGMCAVRRAAQADDGCGEGAAAAGGRGGRDRPTLLYDHNTVSILGPLDTVGVPQFMPVVVSVSSPGRPDSSTWQQQQQQQPTIGHGLGLHAAGGGSGSGACPTGSAQYNHSQVPPTPSSVHPGSTTTAAGAQATPAAILPASPPAAAQVPLVVEAVTQVKTYYVTHEDLQHLSPRLLQVLRDAESFKQSYYEGRLEGLARVDMHHRRRAAAADRGLLTAMRQAMLMASPGSIRARSGQGKRSGSACQEQTHMAPAGATGSRTLPTQAGTGGSAGTALQAGPSGVGGAAAGTGQGAHSSAHGGGGSDPSSGGGTAPTNEHRRKQLLQLLQAQGVLAVLAGEEHVCRSVDHLRRSPPARLSRSVAGPLLHSAMHSPAAAQPHSTTASEEDHGGLLLAEPSGAGSAAGVWAGRSGHLSQAHDEQHRVAGPPGAAPAVLHGTMPGPGPAAAAAAGAAWGGWGTPPGHSGSAGHWQGQGHPDGQWQWHELHGQAHHAPDTCGLDLLPPSSPTFPRVLTFRPQTVETERPRAQSVPVTATQRHLAIFEAARMHGVRAGGWRRLGRLSSDDDDEDYLPPQVSAAALSSRQGGPGGRRGEEYHRGGRSLSKQWGSHLSTYSQSLQQEEVSPRGVALALAQAQGGVPEASSCSWGPSTALPQPRYSNSGAAGGPGGSWATPGIESQTGLQTDASHSHRPEGTSWGSAADGGCGGGGGGGWGNAPAGPFLPQGASQAVGGGGSAVVDPLLQARQLYDPSGQQPAAGGGGSSPGSQWQQHQQQQEHRPADIGMPADELLVSSSWGLTLPHVGHGRHADYPQHDEADRGGLNATLRPSQHSQQPLSPLQQQRPGLLLGGGSGSGRGRPGSGPLRYTPPPSSLDTLPLPLPLPLDLQPPAVKSSSSSSSNSSSRPRSEGKGPPPPGTPPPRTPPLQVRQQQQQQQLNHVTQQPSAGPPGPMLRNMRLMQDTALVSHGTHMAHGSARGQLPAHHQALDAARSQPASSPQPHGEGGAAAGGYASATAAVAQQRQGGGSSSGSSGRAASPRGRGSRALSSSQEDPNGASPSAAAMAMNLPPSVLLGYESLDPFAWAAVMAQVGAARTPYSQDNILPKPKW